MPQSSPRSYRKECLSRDSRETTAVASVVAVPDNYSGSGKARSFTGVDWTMLVVV
jgi:hypothetical protein